MLDHAVYYKLYVLLPCNINIQGKKLLRMHCLDSIHVKKFCSCDHRLYKIVLLHKKSTGNHLCISSKSWILRKFCPSNILFYAPQNSKHFCQRWQVQGCKSVQFFATLGWMHQWGSEAGIGKKSEFKISWLLSKISLVCSGDTLGLVCASLILLPVKDMRKKMIKYFYVEFSLWTMSHFTTIINIKGHAFNYNKKFKRVGYM